MKICSNVMGLTPQSNRRFFNLTVNLAFILFVQLPMVSEAANPTESQRWVLADEVRVREQPNFDGKVIGAVSRGAELTLKSAADTGDFCQIEGEGLYGYVACKYLSDKRVGRRKAGEDGIDAAQRWVSGSGVTLREAPSRQANTISRLGINSIVKLLREEPGSGYCEVQSTSGATGYTACRYLATTPLVLANINGNGKYDDEKGAGYDPERLFWLAPSWSALYQYAVYLKKRHPDIPPQGPWPKDEALERMKAHLALGLNGSKPKPYPDWSEIKRKAAKAPQDGVKSNLRKEQIPYELKSELGLWNYEEEGQPSIIRLVRALDFNKIQPSFFRSEADLAPPYSIADDASGRFGIVFRHVVTPRNKPKSGYEYLGLYDMLAVTTSLVKPVNNVRMFRDGRLTTEPSFLRKRDNILNEDYDEKGCPGYVEGFSYGYADASIWRYMGEGNNAASFNTNPVGSLYAFYTKIDLPRESAIRTETQMKLSRDETGFVSGTYLYYDFDADGIPDIAVWEGKGKGPGHLDGPTKTDDRWYRMVLVNINGAWKVFGHDSFGYGCGC
jgi:Bacterial SH3 domain